MFERSIYQNNPINALVDFLEQEKRHEVAREINKMRFVGYVLELGFESAKIITSDTYKIIVGGIPRGSFLIMAPNDFGKMPPHFSLLRVKGVSTTPLSSQVQQTYFELHKKSMPELDVWTQSELQWGALDCDVLGMFYANPNQTDQLEFSGDVNNIVSAHRYKVYAPNIELLNLIVNGTVTPELQYELGSLRTMECLLVDEEAGQDKVPVQISMKDFKGRRTAMFGKTRLGKSNVVKLIAQGMIDATKDASPTDTVGQLIFDINGEYANDNPQDGNKSLRSANADYCEVYALTPREGTPSKSLRLNFYEYPDSSIQILASMLEADKQTSIYIRSFSSVSLSSFSDIDSMESRSDKTHAARKIMIYWAILCKAGFSYNEASLKTKLRATQYVKNFDPHFKKEIREAVYGRDNVPPEPTTISAMKNELEQIAEFINRNQNSPLLIDEFSPDEIALLKFLVPASGAGPTILRPYTKFHNENAGQFSEEILFLLDQGKTVILDLGNATDLIRRYFSNMLSLDVFHHQESKFVNNKLNNTYVQLYFEEAHNLFPVKDSDLTGVYARFAKEGAKFHIGMVYSTQSPSTINKELLAQTENFFVGHLSSRDEAYALSRLQVAFTGVEDDILRAKTPGFMRMLTMSNRFIIPVQAKLFEAREN
ncbi:MAG: DUF87 domain-containing protein [Clostridiaceae bacterium]|nr:DUF87 domain-containing protein [Clostridiaceae bacterium]